MSGWGKILKFNSEMLKSLLHWPKKEQKLKKIKLFSNDKNLVRTTWCELNKVGSGNDTERFGWNENMRVELMDGWCVNFWFIFTCCEKRALMDWTDNLGRNRFELKGREDKRMKRERVYGKWWCKDIRKWMRLAILFVNLQIS